VDGTNDGSLQLSKEDEASAEEVEVRREDQEKINKFSRLHQRESLLEDQLKQKQVCRQSLPS
jgi:prefoldin subunit 4